MAVKTVASFWAAECRLFWNRWDCSFPVIIVGTVYLYFMQSARFQNESPVSVLSAVTAWVSYSVKNSELWINELCVGPLPLLELDSFKNGIWEGEIFHKGSI
jgi:hypothetical protein